MKKNPMVDSSAFCIVPEGQTFFPQAFCPGGAKKAALQRKGFEYKGKDYQKNADEQDSLVHHMIQNLGRVQE